MARAICEAWKKVVLLEAELGDVRFGLGEESYRSLRSVTHIVHNGESKLSLHNPLLSYSMQPEIPFLSVVSSTKRLMRYSLGSVALGSLIVSFVESIRFLLESVRRKLKISSDTPDSCIGKAAYRTSHFFLRCIEWIIKSVNRNAYIMVKFLIYNKLNLHARSI